MRHLRTLVFSVALAVVSAAMAFSSFKTTDTSDFEPDCCISGSGEMTFELILEWYFENFRSLIITSDDVYMTDSKREHRLVVGNNIEDSIRDLAYKIFIAKTYPHIVGKEKNRHPTACSTPASIIMNRYYDGKKNLSDTIDFSVISGLMDSIPRFSYEVRKLYRILWDLAETYRLMYDLVADIPSDSVRRESPYSIELPSKIESAIRMQYIPIEKLLSDETLEKAADNRKVAMRAVYDLPGHAVVITDISSPGRPELEVTGSLGDSIMAVAERIFVTDRERVDFRYKPYFSADFIYMVYDGDKSIEYNDAKIGTYSIGHRLGYLTEAAFKLYLTIYPPK